MKKIISPFLSSPALVVLLAGLTGNSFAGPEKSIELDEVPTDLKTAATTLLKGFALEKAQIETESDGSETYELIGKHEGVITEIDYNKSDNSLQEYEKQMPVKEVPFAVRKAIQKVYPGIEFTTFEASYNEHHKIFRYEVVGDLDGKALDLEVSPDGREIIESDS